MFINNYLRVKSHPSEVEPQLDSKVLLNQPEWLFPVPVLPLGPLKVQDLKRVDEDYESKHANMNIVSIN